MRFRDSGTRLRGVTVAGDYGNPATIDWTEATLNKLDIACEMQPQGSDENEVQQDRSITRWRLFLPAAADITKTDRWRSNGIDYEVVGDIQPWRFHGADHHIEAQLLRVGGG